LGGSTLREGHSVVVGALQQPDSAKSILEIGIGSQTLILTSDVNHLGH